MGGNLVRTVRLLHGETQEELGRAIGRSRATVSAIEQGKWCPSARTMKAIAEHYGVSVEVLFPALNVREREDVAVSYVETVR